MKRVVIRVPSMNCNESRSKAKKAVDALIGVESVSVKDDEMVVTGDIDVVDVIYRLRKKRWPAEILSVRPARGEKKEDNDNNGSVGGDDDNNGGGGGKNNKKGRDHDGDGDGNGDKNKSDYDDGGGEMKGKNMNFMGKAGFGYRYGYHAGNENEYPVGQLQCAQEVRSSEPKCLFHHAIMIS